MVAVTVTACGSGDSDSDAKVATESSEPALYDARVVPGQDSDSSWVVGGAIASPDGWTANDRAVDIAADGSVRRSVSVPLAADSFLFNAHVADAGSQPWLLGIECPLPVPPNEVLGCALDIQAVAFNLVGEPTRHELRFPAVEQTEAGPGVVRVLGSLDGQVILLRAERVGSLGGDFFEFALYGWTPDNGLAFLSTPPAGNHMFQSFCLAKDGPRVLQPHVAEDFRSVLAGEILELDVGGSMQWRSIGTIDLSGSGATRGGLSCNVTTTVLWHTSSTSGALLHLDNETLRTQKRHVLPPSATVYDIEFEAGSTAAVATVRNAETGNREFVVSRGPGQGPAWTVLTSKPAASTVVGSKGILRRGRVLDSADLEHIMKAERANQQPARPVPTTLRLPTPRAQHRTW